MGFGALGGFEYVAIHAGECRNPVRSIARSVAVAAPIIAAMFILGTSSVLALVPGDQIDLIAPIPQVLSAGFRPFGAAGAAAPLAIAALACVRVAQSSVMFAGTTRLPMVAGWDGVLPPWFTRLDPRYRTPVNSILFVGAATFALATAGLVGVGKQEAFQLLWNASAIFYALTYLVMLAYLLEHADGIAFSRGISDPEEPTIAVRDMTGAITTWIEVGAPDAARLHKASKASRRAVVYTHKDPDQLVRRLRGEKIHRAGD